MKTVTIDGVDYAPVNQSNPHMEAIARGLIRSFWGNLPKGKSLEDALEDLCVYVNDGGKGCPVADVLADIARELAKPDAGKDGK